MYVWLCYKMFINKVFVIMFSHNVIFFFIEHHQLIVQPICWFWSQGLTRGVCELWITNFNKVFCSIVLYEESTWAEKLGSNTQPFSRKIDSKFIKWFIYPCVRNFSEKRSVAQGLKCLTTTLETRVRFPLVPFF